MRPNRRLVMAVLWNLPALTMMGAIWYLSSQPRPPELAAGFDSDKINHAAAYLVLALLIWMGLRQGLGLHATTSVLFAVGLASAYGAIDEIHQSFVPMRHAEILDWVADAFGAAVGGTFLCWYSRLNRRCARRVKG